MILISSVLIYLFFSCATALQFSGSVDRRIRACLLDSLKRFHFGLPPQIANVPLVLEGLATHDLFSYPADFKRSLFENQLDAKSLHFISRTGKYFYQAAEAGLFNRLLNFNPYYATNDKQVNTLLLIILDEHFPTSKTLNSPHIHDELFLLIMKFNHDLLNYTVIPRNVCFYIIAFIYETLYGINSSVPTGITQCKIELVRHLRLKTNPMPRSYDFLVERERESSQIVIETFNIWKEDLDFIIDSPSPSEIKNRFEIIGEVRKEILQDYRLEKELTVAILELLINEISNENLSQIVYKLQECIIFSQEIFDRFADITSSENITYIINRRMSSFSYRVAACKALKTKNYSSIPAECYFYSRDAQNELDPLALDTSDSIEHFLRLARNNRQSIYQLEMFSLLVQLLPGAESNMILSEICMNVSSTTLFFEIAIKERLNPPISIFFNMEGHRLVPIFRVINPINLKKHFMRSFMELMNSSDPFILLAMCFDVLNASKSFITDRFNLNLVYFIDISCYDLVFFNISTQKFKGFAGRTVSFKQIINELAIPGLKEIFSSNPHEFDSLEEVQNSVPISIRQTVQFQYFLKNQ